VRLIINELVSNSLKHAFPGGRKGQITVELTALPDDNVMLIFADDGIGLSGYGYQQIRDPGLKLVSILTEQLKGSVRSSRVRDLVPYHVQDKRS